MPSAPIIETYTANIRIRELPRACDETLEAIAEKRGCNKWEVVRAALVEFTENHKNEVNS